MGQLALSGLHTAIVHTETRHVGFSYSACIHRFRSNSPKLLIARSPRSLGRTDDLVALRDTRQMAQRQVQRGVTR